MRDYILYKNAIQSDTLAIVQYLHHSQGIDARPSACIERCHPAWASDALPCIQASDGRRYIGLDACVEFYASMCPRQMAGEADLLQKSTAFKAAHGGYRIQDVLAARPYESESMSETSGNMERILAGGGGGSGTSRSAGPARRL